MRDNKWLKDQLDFLLKNHFSDVKLTNPLEIKFGREAKYRFGSIKLIGSKGFKWGKRGKGKFSILNSRSVAKALERRRQFSIPKVPQKSIITITKMFAKESVPVDVIRYTIGHELCHYVHGFSSANKRLFRYPHHGSIVNKELTERGASELILSFKRWLKAYRVSILKGKVSI